MLLRNNHRAVQLNKRPEAASCRLALARQTGLGADDKLRPQIIRCDIYGSKRPEGASCRLALARQTTRNIRDAYRTARDPTLDRMQNISERMDLVMRDPMTVSRGYRPPPIERSTFLAY
jgi:hypothetical protein